MPKHHLLMKILIIFLCSFGITNTGLSKESDPELIKEFNQSFQNFEKRKKEKNWRQATKSIERSYEIGDQIFSEEDKRRISLAHLYGKSLYKLRKPDLAKKYFLEALKRAEKKYGKNAPELVDILVDVGTTHIRPFKKGSEMKYYRRALKIAKNNHGAESAQYGNLNVVIGERITMLAMTRGGKPFLTKGLKILEKTAGVKSTDYGLATFNLGKYKLGMRDYDEAVDYLNKALTAFQNHSGTQNQLELSTHAFLVQAYEKLGLQEESTEHCLAIGQMTPQRSKQDFLPIYRASPTYPRAAAESGLEGWVDLKFTVDQAGFIRDPHITANAGHLGFKKAALKAVTGYRYAPAFIDNKPTVTEDVEIRIAFKMAD